MHAVVAIGVGRAGQSVGLHPGSQPAEMAARGMDMRAGSVDRGRSIAVTARLPLRCGLPLHCSLSLRCLILRDQCECERGDKSHAP
jgi:hypothetical protein